MNPNDDFLKERAQPKQYAQKQYGQKAKQEKVKKPTKEELKQYSEYYAMTEYHRSCLAATNYHRVLQGLYEIPVPPSDTHYHKYFDKRCYDRAPEYQRVKAMDSVINSNKKNEDLTDNVVKGSVNKVAKGDKDKLMEKKKAWMEKDLTNQKPVVEEKVIEPIVEKEIQKPVTEFRTMEQQEELKKKSVNIPSQHNQPSVPDVVKPIEKRVDEKKSKNKKEVKGKNNKGDDSQISLF